MLGTLRAITLALCNMDSLPYSFLGGGGGGFTSMSYGEIAKARKHNQTHRRCKK